MGSIQYTFIRVIFIKFPLYFVLQIFRNVSHVEQVVRLLEVRIIRTKASIHINTQNTSRQTYNIYVCGCTYVERETDRQTERLTMRQGHQQIVRYIGTCIKFGIQAI